jgi:heat shock protein HspQ
MSDSDNKGMSTLDMMSMSPAIRRLSRIMLRHSKLSYEGILEKVNEIEESKRPSLDEVKEAVASLVEMKWLHLIEEEGQTFYSVKVARKEGSDVSRVSSGQQKEADQKALMNELWDAVDSGAQAADDGLTAQREMSDFQKDKAEISAPPATSKTEQVSAPGGIRGFFKKLFGG